MTDEEELQQAVDAAEAEVQDLEAEVSALAARRGELSREALATLWAKQQSLARALQALQGDEQSLRAELVEFEHQLQKPGFQLPEAVATPAGWFLRAAAFVVYASSLVAAHRFLQSPGVILALLIALPVAYLLLMVAGSLRESGTADTIGESARQGEEPARLPAVDEGAVTAPAGPGADGPADLRDGRAGEEDRRRD